MADPIKVRLNVDWAGEVYYDTELPWLGVGLKITLPFAALQRTPGDDTHVFEVQEIECYGQFDPPLLVAQVDSVGNEPLTRDDFLNSGWKQIVH